jgi:XTP/dITP diphosphohydrolase
MTERLPEELLIATRNRGKLNEFRQLLADLPVVLRSLSDFPQTTEVEETGSTFAENASIKALAYAAQTGMWALADDSGLAVDALGGAPGVYSARYAGDEASDRERMELLLSELARTGDDNRRARFVCAVAIAVPAGSIEHLSEGRCEGRIAQAPRGTGGFGYDPLFIPEGFEETFGELSSEIKGRISHRARALGDVRAFLLELSGARG